MSAAINPKRLWGIPDRPLSADPSASSVRPSFTSFSSFSSSISSSISSAFGGRHSRSNSTSTQNSSVLARPASAAAQHQTKWVPRPTTPGTANQSRSSRHRSTSSASAAAAALSSTTEAPLPPLPDSQHRGSPAPPGEGADVGPDAWRASIQRAAASRYHRRVRAAERDLRDRLRATLASGGLNAATVSSRRRDSLSSGSSGSPGSLASSGGSTGGGHMSEEMRLRESYEQTLAKLRSDMDEEVRTELREEARRRGISPFPPPPNPSAPVLAPSHSRRERERVRGVIVEDDDSDEGSWQPEEHGQRPSENERASEKDKWREAVRQEQQVIWDAIKRGGTPPLSQQQQPLSSSAGRKVHFAPSTPPSSDASSNSNLPSAASLSASQTQPPSLPRTPHTPAGPGYPSHISARSLSAHPSVSASAASRPLSPAVAAAGVRPGSARPASPAYTRWIPSTGGASVAVPSTLGPNAGQGQGMGGRTPSNPIAIPGRGGGANAGSGEGNGSAGRERTASMGGSGSWREWSAPAPHVSGVRRDTSTPSPTAANGSSHGHGRTASNSNLHSSVYATVHARTPSSGNLHTSHGRTPSNSNLQSGAGMRRALTPGAMSSASGYARQRTASATQRAPSVPPVLPSAAPARDAGRERDYTYGKEYTSRREKERRAKAGVVDDREPEDASHAHVMNAGGRMKQVQASAGLGSRQSSTRSALVDEDAPPPEVFSSSPAPIPIRTSSSRHSQRPGEEEEEGEEEERAPRKDKGKGKARAPPSPVVPPVPLPGVKRGSHGTGGMYAAQLEDFASVLRRDLGISAEA